MSGQSWKLNVETCSRQEYLKFLEDLRIALGERWTIGADGRNYPILALQSDSMQWIDIRLETNHNSISLRVSRGNLYIKGFETRDGHVFELAANRRDQVFDGSRLLGFGGSYRELLRAAGRPNSGRITTLLQGVPLGLDRLTSAVDSLARNPRNRRVAGESLLQMVWMISEAARFTRVAETVGNRPDVAVDAFMANLVMLWRDLSRRVLQVSAYPQLFDFNVPEPVSGELGISTVAELLRILGIVLYALPKFIIWDRLKLEAASSFRYIVGTTLLEVFYVTIDNIDGENPGDLYGSITVTDSYISQYLFNRSRDGYQSIRPGSNALLIGPAKPISANDSFTIDFNLMDEDSDASPDDEVVNDQISWNPYEAGNVWNQSIKQVVRGRYGQATVCYGVFENAVVANVEVKVLNADDEDPADVYGWVKAKKNIEDVELFGRGSGEYLEIRPGQLIPLTRSTVVVPLSDALRISAYLWDYDSGSADDNFADGSATFAPKPRGTEKQNISGRYGQVEVQVTWSLF